MTTDIHATFESLDFVYVPTVARVRAAGLSDIHELEIPQGPCASFHLPDGQRVAVYELVRPGATDHFVGRVDD